MSWLDEIETIPEATEAMERLLPNDIIIVKDKESYDAAAEIARGLKELENEVKGHYTPLKRKSQDAHKALVAAEREQLAPIQEKLHLVKSKMSEYQRELQRQEQERAKKLRALEEEKIRRQYLAELEGRNEEAAQIAKIDTTQLVPDKVEVKAEGVHTRKNWKWELASVKDIDRAYLIPDEKLIGSIVRAEHKKAEDIVGGIRVWCEENVIVR